MRTTNYPKMGLFGDKLEIFQPIIALYAILVVNLFRSLKFPAQMLLHNKSVLKYVFSLSLRVWDKKIPTRSGVSTLKFCLINTFARAKLPFLRREREEADSTSKTHLRNFTPFPTIMIFATNLGHFLTLIPTPTFFKATKISYGFFFWRKFFAPAPLSTSCFCFHKT